MIMMMIMMFARSLSTGSVPQLVVLDHLDRELLSSCAGTLTVVDGGSPPRSASLELVVRLIDTNDNSPTFERNIYNVTVREDIEPGSAIIQVDQFAEHNISYKQYSRSSPQ